MSPGVRLARVDDEKLNSVVFKLMIKAVKTRKIIDEYGGRDAAELKGHMFLPAEFLQTDRVPVEVQQGKIRGLHPDPQVGLKVRLCRIAALPSLEGKATPVVLAGFRL
jgi:hypothetical protein